MSQPSNTRSSVEKRYADAAKAPEAALCCPVEYDRKYLKFLEYMQVHTDIDFDRYEKINDQEMDDLLKDFGDFFND